MKKFKFKFATLESLRKRREEAALRVLGASQRAFQAAIEHKVRLISELGASLERRENLASREAAAVEFLIENDFISGTKQRIVQAEQGIFRARKAVEKALRAYLAARKQTRVIELLRERAFEEYKRARDKAELREQDDLNVMRFRINEERAQ